MTQDSTNTMAAILSQLILGVFWLSILVLLLGIALIGAGIVGTLNGGALSLPMFEAWTDGVSTASLLAVFIDVVVFAVGLAYICFQLRAILSTLVGGDPFVPENAPRLTRIALALGLIEIVGLAIQVLMVGGAGVDLATGIPVMIRPVIVGVVVVLLILAQVFREGTRLREAEKMTI